MPRKPKFKPEITRVKLNPEQAILACRCYPSGIAYTHNSDSAGTPYIPACTYNHFPKQIIDVCWEDFENSAS